MRALERNKIPVWYALNTGEVEEVSPDGYHTGRMRQTYSAPLCIGVNVAGARGTAFLTANGIETDYTHRLVTCDMNLPWQEDTILWIYREPYETVDGQTVPVPHNFVIVRVSRAINSVIYDLQEVRVS
jgi:hypothetical protein